MYKLPLYTGYRYIQKVVARIKESLVARLYVPLLLARVPGVFNQWVAKIF